VEIEREKEIVMVWELCLFSNTFCCCCWKLWIYICGCHFPLCLL